MSRDRDWKLSDEKGLFLLVTTKGSKLWRMKFRIHGIEKKLSFGSYPEVNLQTARRLRDEARAMIAEGRDPSREKKIAKQTAKLSAVTTFAGVAQEYIEKKEKEGLAVSTTDKSRWLLSLLLPSIGKVPIADITPPELLAALVSIQDSGRRETARRLRSFAGRVFDYAIGTGRATNNPVVPLKGALITPTVKHHSAIIEPKQIGVLMQAIETYQGYPSTCGALKLSPHVFQRPGEIRMMKWADVDLEGARWTIQEQDSKMRRRHDVPLSHQAASIIRSMVPVSSDSQFVFPAFHTPKRPISENSVNQALKRLGFGQSMTAHGFRSTASSLLNESRLWHPDVIERALAHQVGSSIRSAYNHTTYWNERVEMMQWWSDELDRLKRGAPQPRAARKEPPQSPRKGPQSSVASGGQRRPAKDKASA
jgi:integrase